MRLRAPRSFDDRPAGAHDRRRAPEDSSANGTAVDPDGRPEGSAAAVSGRGTPRPGRSVGADFARHVWSVVHAGALVIAVVGGLLLLLVLTARHTSILGVRHVQVAGTSEVATEDVVRAVGVDVGTPIAGIDTDAAASRVRRVPGVESASVDRIWPTTLRVSVVERVPVLGLETPDGLVAVDRHGEQFGSDVALPDGLVVFSPPEVRREETVRAVAAAVSALGPELRELVVSVTASSPRSVTLGLTENRTVSWGDSGESERKARVLRALLAVEANDYDVSVPDLALVR